MAVAQYAGVGLGGVVAHELLLALSEGNPVGGLYGGGVARAGFLRLHLLVESGLVECHAVLLEDELREVERETIGVVEHEGFLARNLCFPLFAGLGYGRFEHLDAVFEGAQEGILLLFCHLHD